MNNKHLLDIKHLQVEFNLPGSKTVHAVDDCSFYLDRGEIIGIVGESGSGKSVSMMSILQLIQMPPGKIAGGEAYYDGKNILEYGSTSEEIRHIRGGDISVIFQEPMTSLNPVLTIGQQITENIMLHLGYSRARANERAAELLTMVGIPDGRDRLSYYPTQFSGGMRQRVMIAMAMSSNPKVLIADEATTALDVTTQEQILELLRSIAKQTETALIIITHNLSVVARYAERIYVMYAGNVVETGTAMELFKQPHHPYTIGLLNAVPRLDGDKSRYLLSIDGVPINPSEKDGRCPFLSRCKFACDMCHTSSMPEKTILSDTHQVACFRADDNIAEIVEQQRISRRVEPHPVSQEVILKLEGVSKYYPVYKGIARRKIADVKALDGVSFEVHRGETVGLVGESGCGKTTLAKSILRIHDVTEGTITFNGQDITHLKGNHLRDFRRNIQFVFQDPYGSLDPRQTAGSIIGEPLRTYNLTNSRLEYDQRISKLMKAVGLDPALKDRVPHEFSGGQRQRISIARALASEPSFLILDEPISALDVSIQAQVINLLSDLRKERNLSFLFIAHDLSVVRHLSDRIVVMYLGKVMEISPWDELYERPLHPYTKALLSAIPIPDPEVEQKRERNIVRGEVPSLLSRPQGCVFHNRCPLADQRCATETPVARDCGNGHCVACWKA